MAGDTEPAVTGRRKLVADRLDDAPTVGKRLKLPLVGEGKRRRPNKIFRQGGPEWDGKVYKPAGDEHGIPYLFNHYKLESEVPDGAGAHIHQAVLGGSTLEIGGFNLPVSAFDIATKP